MVRRIPLNETLSVVLDGSGGGKVVFQPRGQFQVWYPAAVQVYASTRIKEAQAFVYLGSTSGIAYANSQSGSTGDVCGISGFTLYPGQSLSVVWNGGDVGAVATANLFGDNELPR